VIRVPHGLLREQQVTVAHFVSVGAARLLRQEAARTFRRCAGFLLGRGAARVAAGSVFDPGAGGTAQPLRPHRGSSIDVTAWACDPQDGAVVPIGPPITNLRTYVPTSTGDRPPIRDPRELYLAGAGPALRLPQPARVDGDPFVPCPSPGGERMYRTGDVARWRADGALEYSGATTPVKIRGLRWNSGEIEHVLAGIRKVHAAAVTVCSPGERRPFLAAYLVGSASTTQQRATTSDRLPCTMVPRRVTTWTHSRLTAAENSTAKHYPTRNRALRRRTGATDRPKASSGI